MLKFTKNFNSNGVEYWREYNSVFSSENILFVPIDAIGLNPQLGSLPRHLFRNLGLKILKISWKDGAKTLRVENIEKIMPVHGCKRASIAQGLDNVTVQSAIERAIANLFFTIAKDPKGDFFHSSGQFFHKVKMNKDFFVSENDSAIAHNVVEIVRGREHSSVKNIDLIKV
ncbi:MAG: hypothetical protein HXK95_001525 [Candidatus Nanogingivalaceae bacterium]|jgi:hypothetical protein|nr:MAG: hypothetical protein HXK94_001520 [Candidatus Nanogingivalaceae bacterium]QWB91876.1 MAG: hypothetical protein HXK95_001525 [Candidatus Nanogingivalaceae bacterium]